jgi:SAM-dependent methyltransferase
MELAPVLAAGAVLHIGCGTVSLPEWLDGRETRLDIDPRCEPDILASMTDLGDIGPFDSIYCSHALEHLNPDDVKVALREFRRVLRDGGAALLFVPNLEGVSPTQEVLYESVAGPITGHDLYYGASFLVADNPYMAHKSGFIAETLKAAFLEAGFSSAESQATSNFNLFGAAVK